MSVSVQEIHARRAVRSNEAIASAARKPSVCFVGLDNLAVLAPQYLPGGAAGEPVQQTLLARAFARRGYRTSMVIADYGQPDGATWDGVQTFKAFAFSAGLPVLRFVHPRWSGLWSALKRADADVYYASCAGGMVGQVAMFCALHGRKFIFRVASDADCAPDTLLIKRYYWRDSRLYEYGLRRAASVLAQSHRQQELLKRNFGVNSAVAGLMVDPAPSYAQYSQREIDALWVSNIRVLKRPDTLLSVAAALPQLSFHMAGGRYVGEHPFFDQIRTQAEASGNVTFHGAVPYGDIGSLYRRARAFINTSDIEGFPNSYLQAWASGTPVVAFFDPDGLIARHGLGIAVRDRDGMVEAVKSLVLDEAAWRRASARCREFIEREYSEERVLEPYLKSVHA